MNRILNWIIFQQNSNIELNQIGYQPPLDDRESPTVFKKILRFGHFHCPRELDWYNHNVDNDIGVDVDDGAGLVVDGDVDVAVDVGGDFTISFVRPALDGRRQKQPLTAGTYSSASQPGLTFEDFQTICKKKFFFLRTICKNMSGQTISKKEVYSDALYCVGAVGDTGCFF